MRRLRNVRGSMWIGRRSLAADGVKSR